jgi:STE24 endopeptidase
VTATPSTWRHTPNDPHDWFTDEELDRARRYQQPLTKLRLIRGACGLTLLLAFILLRVPAHLVDALGVTNWFAQLAVIFIALQLLSLVYDVPLDWWVDLVHDKQWELSTQTRRGFVSDQIKSLLLTTITGLAVLAPLYYLVRTTDAWWLYGWLVVFGFSLIFGFVYPIVIAPLFNTFTRLEGGEVAERVDTIAGIGGVHISGTYVADESRRSRRDNAYVAGLGATRRVVLFDTLLEHPVDVVAQVVAHEIGHWRLHHLRRQLPLAALLSLAVFVGLYALSQWTWLLDVADVDAFGDPASLPLVLLAVQLLFGLSGLASAVVSRAFERQADAQALELLGDPDGLIEMHRRLHVKNLADLDPGPLRRLNASHPPAAERMAFAQAWGQANAPTFVDHSPSVHPGGVVPGQWTQHGQTAPDGPFWS